MGRRSSVDQLPEALRDAVHAAIADGRTIDELVALIRGGGGDVSRSAAGRYAKRYSELASRQRDLRSVAEGFGRDFGHADDKQGKLMIQLLHSMITQQMLNLADDDEAAFDGQELHFFARAVKDATSAAKTDTDREIKIRDEAAKAARKKAADVAESAGRQAGVSAEVIRRIKADILGLKA